MRTIVKILFCQVIFTCMVAASNFSLVTSLTTAGSMSGGLRYVLPSADTIDFGVSYNDQDSKNPGIWADYYRGNFGVLVTKQPDLLVEYAAMFSTERTLLDNITVGIGVKVVNVNQGRTLDYFTGWDAYLVVPI